MGGIQWGRGIVGKGGWVSSPCGSGVEDWDFFSFRLGGVSGFFLTPGTFHFKAVSPWIFLINFFSAGEGGRGLCPRGSGRKKEPVDFHLWFFIFGFSVSFVGWGGGYGYFFDTAGIGTTVQEHFLSMCLLIAIPRGRGVPIPPSLPFR